MSFLSPFLGFSDPLPIPLPIAEKHFLSPFLFPVFLSPHTPMALKRPLEAVASAVLAWARASHHGR